MTKTEKRARKKQNRQRARDQAAAHDCRLVTVACTGCGTIQPNNHAPYTGVPTTAGALDAIRHTRPSDSYAVCPRCDQPFARNVSGER